MCPVSPRPSPSIQGRKALWSGGWRVSEGQPSRQQKQPEVGICPLIGPHFNRLGCHMGRETLMRVAPPVCLFGPQQVTCELGNSNFPLIQAFMFLPHPSLVPAAALDQGTIAWSFRRPPVPRQGFPPRVAGGSLLKGQSDH